MRIREITGNSMKRFHLMLLLLQRSLLRHPKKFVFIFTFVFSILFLGSAKLQFLLSIDDLVDSDFTTYAGLKKVNENFKDKNTILLSLESDRIFTKSFLCELQTWIWNTAKKRQDLIQIQSSFGAQQAEIKDNNRLLFNSFLDVNCQNDELELEKIAIGFQKILVSPWGPLLSSNKNFTLTINFIVRDPEDKRYGSIDTQVVADLQNDFQKTFSHQKDIQTFWGGVTTYQSHLRKSFDQTQVLNFLMFVLSLIIFRVFLGSWKAGFIFNGTVFISLLASYGIMGHLNIPVDVLTNSTGLMVIIGSLEDLVFVIFGMMKFKWSLQKSLRKFLLPAFFTSLTTAIGFGSLVVSDLGIIRRFGFISSFALMFEWVVVFLLLPAVIKLKPQLALLKFKEKIIQPNDPMQFKVSKAVAYLLIILTSISLFFINKIQVSDTPESFFSKDHTISKTSQHLQYQRGWINEVSLVFNDETTENQKIEIMNLVKKLDIVAYTEFSVDIKSYLTQKLTQPTAETVKELWENSQFSRRLISENGIERAQLFLKTMDNDSITSFRNKIAEICETKNCEIAGSIISYNEFGTRILSTLLESLGLSILLVALIILLISTNLKFSEIFACIASSVWGPLTLLGIFIIFEIPMSFVSSICASVLVGLAGDNAIQFVFATKKNNFSSSMNSLSKASLIITIGMIMLTSIFFFSSLEPLAKLGVFIVLGFILGYLGDVWILRGLLKK